MALETREQKIERLAQANPDVPMRVIASIVDNVELAKDEFAEEVRSMKVNSVLGTMDPMYT